MNGPRPAGVPLRVLVLGGTGFIGQRLALRLREGGWAMPVVASRRGGRHGLRLDARDASALGAALRQVDAAVFAVAGSASAITDGARALARAARATGLRQVVNLSSMAVYGAREGLLAEDAAPGPARGWYARAKREAEAALGELGTRGVAVTQLRPGCVWGPGSPLWVGRIGEWLAAGRLGDLGPAGDGWTNGVHVDDVAQAVAAALRQGSEGGEGGSRVFNLAAPDSPRWNAYFTDLALALQATPLARLGPWRLALEAWLAGPALHLARRAREAAAARWPLPSAISPGLLALWRRQQRLDAAAAASALGLDWTPYPAALNQAAAWWLAQRKHQPAPGP